MSSKEKARKVQRGLRVNPKSEKAAGEPYCAQFELLQVFVIYLDSKLKLSIMHQKFHPKLEALHYILSHWVGP